MARVSLKLFLSCSPLPQPASCPFLRLVRQLSRSSRYTWFYCLLPQRTITVIRRNECVTMTQDLDLCRVTAVSHSARKQYCRLEGKDLGRLSGTRGGSGNGLGFSHVPEWKIERAVVRVQVGNVEESTFPNTTCRYGRGCPQYHYTRMKSSPLRPNHPPPLTMKVAFPSILAKGRGHNAKPKHQPPRDSASNRLPGK